MDRAFVMLVLQKVGQRLGEILGSGLERNESPVQCLSAAEFRDFWGA